MRAKAELPMALPSKAADTDNEDAEVAAQKIPFKGTKERRGEKKRKWGRKKRGEQRGIGAS